MAQTYILSEQGIRIELCAPDRRRIVHLIKILDQIIKIIQLFPCKCHCFDVRHSGSCLTVCCTCLCNLCLLDFLLHLPLPAALRCSPPHLALPAALRCSLCCTCIRRLSSCIFFSSDRLVPSALPTDGITSPSFHPHNFHLQPPAPELPHKRDHSRSASGMIHFQVHSFPRKKHIDHFLHKRPLRLIFYTVRQTGQIKIKYFSQQLFAPLLQALQRKICLSVKVFQ